MTKFSVVVGNASKLAANAIADAFAPPQVVDYVKWAEQNIVFTKRESPFPGPYNRELFGYFDEILKALSPGDPCRTVSLAKSAQIGGTVLANIFVGGTMDMDPSDIMFVHPTEGNATRWSKMKLSPMLKGTTALREIFPMRSRDGSDSILYKERTDGKGAITISGANSPATLSQVTMPRQVQDDLSKWEKNAAGDPETQANSRSRGIEFAKIFKVSTPLILPGCKITANFEAGSQESCYLPCPHCGHMQTLEWENMLHNLDEEHPEQAHFVCTDPECGGVIEEHHRPEMLKKREWRAENPKAMRFHRSFYLWSAYSLLQSFDRIAREWLDAKGDPASEQTFLNDTIGKGYQTKGEAPPWELIRDRSLQSHYPRGTIPAGYSIVTVGVDCQGDRVEWHAVAWGRERRRAVIDYGVIPGHISETKCRVGLDALLRQKFKNSVGHKISSDMTAIDGNAYTEDVWDWVKKHPVSKVIMVRGVGQEHAPLFVRVRKEHNKQGKKVRYSRRFYNFAASVLKMALYRNLAKEDPLERGYVDFPTGLEDEYCRQLTAERRIAVRDKFGFTSYKWDKDGNQANEALDTMNQAEVASIKFGVRGMLDELWDKYELEREQPLTSQQLDLEDLMQAPEPKTDVPSPDAPVNKSFENAVKKWANRR